MNTISGLTPHTARNSWPILEVLRNEFRALRSVLEIGSGSGQHATVVASELRHLVWQTSDRCENHSAIRRWLREASEPRVLDPIALDVLRDAYPAAKYDAVFSANTAHIMSMTAVRKMFDIVASVLQTDGVFCLYGPFRCDGEFNSASNADFHRSLREQDGAMGIRHLEELREIAISVGLRELGLYAMPANNLMVVWCRT